MMPRRLKLRKKDFIGHGYTIGCPGCESIQLSSNVRRGHNEECRSRMEKELSETDRAVRAKDRIDEKVAQMGEQVMQGQGEITPEVTELVDGPEESREDASHPAEGIHLCYCFVKIFCDIYLVWATGFMFLISWRGYWQELIETIVWAHERTPLANLVRWKDKPVALSIVQARLVGLAHFTIGYIFTYAPFVIASTLGKFG